MYGAITNASVAIGRISAFGSDSGDVPGGIADTAGQRLGGQEDDDRDREDRQHPEREPHYHHRPDRVAPTPGMRRATRPAGSGRRQGWLSGDAHRASLTRTTTTSLGFDMRPLS